MDDKPNYQMRVGFWALIAAMMLIYGWSWLKGLTIHPPQRFTVTFHDVAGLNNNAPINVNGVRVGTIEKLSIKEKGLVVVNAKITNEDIVIPQGSVFTIQTLGLVGAKYIEIGLPIVQPGEPEPPALTKESIVVGQDPVRVELVMNKVATNIGNINFNDVESTLRKDMERMAKAADSVQDTAARFGTIAGEAKGASSSANQFFARGTRSFDKIDELANGSRNSMQHISALSDDWRTTSKKLNKILDNPALSADLKDAMDKAKQTADTVQSTMQDVKKTLQDASLRGDLLTALDRLNASTDNVYKSVKTVQTLTGDKELRSDVKQMVNEAKDAMTKANDLLSQPNFVGDAKVTMEKLRRTSDDVDAVAQQLNAALGEKRPLWKLMFGKIKVKPKAEPEKKEQLATPQKLKDVSNIK